MAKINFYTSHNDMLQYYLFSDLLHDQRVYFYDKGIFRETKTSLKTKAFKVSTGLKCSFIDSIYLFVFSLLFCKLPFSKGRIYCFTSCALIGMSPLYFKLFFLIHFWKKPYIIFIDCTDKLMGRNAFRCSRMIKFNNCYTYEQKDVDRYGFKKTYNMYSYHFVDHKPLKYDCFFVGYAADRMAIIEMVNDFIKNETTSLFLVAGFPSNKKVTGCMQSLADRLDYKEILNYVSETNCILEINQGGTAGPTMRFFEAVFYNKKLLTNNKNVVNFPFYDSRFIKVFDTKEDIDVDWIKKIDRIDYHYDNRFSPTKLIDEIIGSYK